MNFKWDALNQWRRKKKWQLQAKWEELPEGPTRRWIDTKEAAAQEQTLFMFQDFVGEEHLRPVQWKCTPF